MQPILEIKAFFFNAETDYLPYYKNFSIELAEDMQTKDILAFIQEQNENFTYPEENLIFKINGLVIDGDQSMSEVVERLGTSLQIDPVNSYRSSNGLIIDDSDFMKSYELLAPFASDEDLEYYKTLYALHYASETENFDRTYIGDAILVLAHKLITAGSEQKEEILEAITYPYSSLLDCEYENNLFHAQDHSAAIEELKMMIVPSPKKEPSLMDMLVGHFSEIKNEILSTLTNSLKLYKVILFGSSAAGKAKKDSDIDLIVVTDDDFMPRNYEENMKNYLKVSAVLRDIKTRLPIDLIVHTKPMHEKFIHLGSMFSKNVMRRGEVLYEKDI